MNAAEVIADLLARGHSVRFHATGHSMHPIIRHGDYLLVEPVREIRTGDVVLTLADRGLTAHRVCSLERGMVVTRGDNAPANDDPVETARVIGVVTHAERQGKMCRIVRARGVLLGVRRLCRRVLLRAQRASGL